MESLSVLHTGSCYHLQVGPVRLNYLEWGNMTVMHYRMRWNDEEGNLRQAVVHVHNIFTYTHINSWTTSMFNARPGLGQICSDELC